MSCTCTSATLAGLVQDCCTNLGGVKRVWIAPYAESIITEETSGDSKTGKVEIAESATTSFQYYYFRKNTANMTSTLTVDASNGTNYVSTDLVMTFSRMETTKRTEVAAMALADMLVVVEDANGTYWALGKDNPVTCTAGTGQTGTAKSDGNNYQITLNDESLSYPYELNAATMAIFDKIGK